LKNTKLIIQMMALAPVIFIPAIVLFAGTLIIDAEEENYRTAISQVEDDFIETEKSRIRSKVNNMVDLVEYRQSVINQRLHSRIQRRVEDAHKIALALYEKYHKNLSEPELKSLIIESLRPLEWNEGESYIWVVDHAGVLQLGPDYMKGMESLSIIDLEDVNGRKIIQEEIALTQNQGQGFLWDTFTKPNAPKDKQYKQLAFVKNLGLFDWYLGSAEFLDTAKELTNTHLLEAINQIGKGDSDYVFVIDTEGNLLLNYARPDIVGRNMSETKDKHLHELYQKILRAGASQREEFITYNWLNPRTGKVDAKMTYVKNVPSSKWVIGSGFYPRMLERGYEAQRQRLTTQYNQKIQYYNTLTWLSVMGALLVASLMSLIFYRFLTVVQQRLTENNDGLKALNLELEESLIDKSRELDALHQRLNDLKTKDVQTQLPNRGYILQRLDQEINRANRYHSSLSIVLVEISSGQLLSEKAESDVFEAAIIQLSSELKKVLRNVDLIGRLGRREFLVIMPENGLSDVLKSANRIRELLQGKVIAEGIDISVNVATVEYQQGQNMSDLLKKLDDTLFESRELQK